MGVRLPSAYQEVAYIDGTTGGEHIETGIYPKKFDGASIKFQFLSGNSAEYRVFGAYLPGVAVDSYTGLRIWAYTDNQIRPQNKIFDGNVHTIVCTESGTWTYDETTVLTNKPIETQNRVSITLFRMRYSNGEIYGEAVSRIYSFEYTRNGEAICTFVPCYRKSDNEPGFYDLVSDAFFANAGTGEFLVGPDVIDSISPLLVARRRGLMMRKPKAYLYNYGQVGAFTGGFDIPQTVWAGYSRNPTIAEDYVQFNGVTNVNTFLPFKSAIDLTNYSKLVMDVDIESTLGKYLAVRGHINSIPNTGAQYGIAQTPSTTDPALLGRNEIEIDVSQINQAAYIYFAVGGVTAYQWKLYRAWLE